jgi:hypothetical protein
MDLNGLALAPWAVALLAALLLAGALWWRGRGN